MTTPRRTLAEIIATVRAMGVVAAPVVVETAELLRLVAEIDRLRTQDAEARDLLQAIVEALTVPDCVNPRDWTKELTYLATRAAGVCAVLSSRDGGGFSYSTMAHEFRRTAAAPPPYPVNNR